nr:hypothetical protein [Tanacetum cinerariifolium]
MSKVLFFMERLEKRFSEVKNASTPMETQKNLVKDEDGEEVDVHMYRSMIGSLRHTLTTGGFKLMLLGINLLLLMMVNVVEEHVTDEAVNKEMNDSLESVATTATSLDAEQDRGDIFKTQSKVTHNEPGSQGTSLGGVNTPRSGEDSLKLTELMELCTKSQQRVLDLETTKTTQALEIESLKRRVKKLERRKRSRTYELKRLYKFGLLARVEYSEDEGLGEEDASKHGNIADIDSNEDIYLVNVHNNEEMFDADQDLGGEELFAAQLDEKVVEEEEKVDAHYQLAQRLQVEEQEALTDEDKARLLMELLKKRKRSLLLKELKKRGIDHQKKLNKGKAKAEITQEGSSKRVGDELEQERSKKQKVKDDKEFEELKKCLEIIPDDGDDVTIHATPLSTKSSTIIDYKIHKEEKKSYFQIFRVDGNFQMYMTFSKMLKNFDREDLEVL